MFGHSTRFAPPKKNIKVNNQDDHVDSTKVINKISRKKAIQVSDRLLLWKKQASIKRELRAKIKEEERLEEEERILIQLKQKQKKLDRDTIDQSVCRMYQMAETNHWKLVKKRTKQDQLRMQEEVKECTFHPQIQKTSRATTITRHTIRNVHTRLYTQAMIQKTNKAQVPIKEEKVMLSPQALDEFIIRQEIDQAYRSLQQFHLDRKYSYPFRPSLSMGTQRLSEMQRLDTARRRRRRYTCPTPCPTTAVNTTVNQQQEDNIPHVPKEDMKTLKEEEELEEIRTVVYRSPSTHHSTAHPSKINFLPQQSKQPIDPEVASSHSYSSSSHSEDEEQVENQQESPQRRIPNNRYTSLVDKLLFSKSSSSSAVPTASESARSTSFPPLRNFEELLQALALEEQRLLSK